jgi:hypothetical protein
MTIIPLYFFSLFLFSIFFPSYFFLFPSISYFFLLIFPSPFTSPRRVGAAGAGGGGGAVGGTVSSSCHCRPHADAPPVPPRRRPCRARLDLVGAPNSSISSPCHLPHLHLAGATNSRSSHAPPPWGKDGQLKGEAGEATFLHLLPHRTSLEREGCKHFRQGAVFGTIWHSFA